MMINNYAKLSAIILAGMVGTVQVSAQSNTQRVARQKHEVVRTSNTPIQHSVDRAVLWSDDFSVPSTWVNAMEPGSFNLMWEIGIGLMNTGSFPTDPITSTTVANGYAMYDSDGGNNPGSIEENAHLTTASPIDLTGFPNVKLEFENYYRRFNPNRCFVVVSTDGTFPVVDGTTDVSLLPNVWEIFTDIGVNDATTNPELLSINISSVAGNQPTVWVRFQWTGSYGYTWFLDDVAIVEQQEYDGTVDFGVISHTGGGEEYGRVPTVQLGPTMNLGAQVRNIGFTDLTNVSVAMEVRDAGNSVVFSANSTIGTMLPDDTVYVSEDPTIPALSTGIYTASFVINSDQSPNDGDTGNDTIVRAFAVDDEFYTLDGLGLHLGPEDVNGLGTGSFTDNDDAMYCMAYYPSRQAQMVYGLDVLLSTATVAGGDIIGSMQDSTIVIGSDDPSQTLASSLVDQITAADVAAGFKRLIFQNPFNMQPGAYYAAVELYSNANASDISVIDDATVPQPDLASVVYLPDGSPSGIFTNGNAFAIQLLLDPTVSIEEVENTLEFSVFPNPSLDGLVTVNVGGQSRTTATVTNALGEVVLTEQFVAKTTLDLRHLAKGVYSVHVSDGTLEGAKLVARH